MADLDMSALFGVTGKKVLVTGGGSGIGNMIATAFARNGAVVYIVGRRLSALQTAVNRFDEVSPLAKGNIIALQGDVSSKDAIEALATAYGKMETILDVLVNNAGIHINDPIKSHPNDTENLLESLWSSDWAAWQRTQDINVTALYFMSVAFAPFLHQAFVLNPSTEENPRETPSIVNIGSIGGLHNSRTTSTTSYQTSKAAVVFLTKILATRLTPLRIRVNCCAPGLFPSEMTSGTGSAEALRTTQADQFKAMPEGRAGSPPDIAGPCIFLASRAGAYLNGNTLDVGGGRCLMVSGHVMNDVN